MTTSTPSSSVPLSPTNGPTWISYYSNTFQAEFSVDQMHALLDRKQNIRSISVIGHKNHGKTTLKDTLVQKAGILSYDAPRGKRYNDEDLSDEGRLADALPSTNVSMVFKYGVPAEVPGPKEDHTTNLDKSYLINLIDCPGHAYLAGEVTAALRITDGALIVMDTIDGMGVQTETALRQAISERVKPVLMVNKVDRVLLELRLSGEELYQAFCRAIESVNVIVSMYNDETLGDCRVDPTTGTVAFGSGLHQWTFTLKRFARIYAAKFGVHEAKMLNKLWGDWYFNAARKVWTNNDEGGTLERAFCQFIVTPIVNLFEAIMNEKHGKVKKMIKAIGVELNGDEKKLKTKQLLKRVMQKWLPAGDTVLEMIVLHLPSPLKAQAYRVDTLYEGPHDDATATAIRTCDTSPNAPLCMYISKMVRSRNGDFFSLGRVFSGTIATGQKVRIMGPKYDPGKNHRKDLWVKNIQRISIMMGRYPELVSNVPAGNICALRGVDQYLLKTGTICTEDDAHTIKTMKFSVSPVVRCAVEPKSAADLPKLVESMKCLSKLDAILVCYTEESGEHFIAASDELHLEIRIQDLQNDFMGSEVKVSDPIVTFRETCASKSSQICLAKTCNKFNKLYVEADSIGAELSLAIDEGEIRAGRDVRLQAREMANKYGWDVSDARKIWAFGPNGTGPNLYVNATQGFDNLHNIKSTVISGFDWASQCGPLCEEEMRGCRFNLMDVVINAYSIERSMASLCHTSRRVCYASFLAAKPGLLEPVYLCDMSVPQDAMDAVYGLLTQRRGHIFSEEQKLGTPHMTLLAYLPVMESFGFTADLCSNTGGKAFSQYSFDHWEPMSGDPYVEGNKCNETVLAVRRRKGLKVEVPPIALYLDKL